MRSLKLPIFVRPFGPLLVLVKQASKQEEHHCKLKLRNFQLAVIFLLLLNQKRKGQMAEHIYIENFSGLGPHEKEPVSRHRPITHDEFQPSIRFQTWREREQGSLADTKWLPYNQERSTSMSPHHIRDSPIGRNDIGKKCLRRSRCLRTMEDSESNMKFNTMWVRLHSARYEYGVVRYRISRFYPAAR